MTAGLAVPASGVDGDATTGSGVRPAGGAATTPRLDGNELDGNELDIRRRRLETVTLIARTIGMIMTTIGLFKPYPGAESVAPRVWISIHVLILVLLSGANIASLLTFTRAGSRRYTAHAFTQLSLDTFSMIGVAAAFSAVPGSVAWPVVIIPIFMAAVRFKLLVTLLAWAVASLGYTAVVLASPSLYGHAVEKYTIFLEVGFGLILAFMEGGRAREIARHVADLQATRLELRQLALHDPLTGLGNRTCFYERVRENAGESPTGLLLIDLDGFKQVNDEHGHGAGDELLVVVAERLLSCVRPSDLVARLGGDEFVVLLDPADRELAEVIAARIRTRLSEPISLSTGQVRIGGSVGTAVAGGKADIDRVIAEADTAMYAEKARVKAARSNVDPRSLVTG